MNPRPLAPPPRTDRPARSEGVGRGVSHLRQRPDGVAASLRESTYVGSPSWLPWLPRAAESSCSAFSVCRPVEVRNASGTRPSASTNASRGARGGSTPTAQRMGGDRSSLVTSGRRTSATTSTECAWGPRLPESRGEPDLRRRDVDVELEPQARRESGQSVDGGSDLSRFETSNLRLLHAEQLR